MRFEIKDKKNRPIYHLPSLPQEKESLRSKTLKGLEKRLEKYDLLGESLTKERKKEYEERIDYELKIIKRNGF